jgi:hypothetical protein
MINIFKLTQAMQGILNNNNLSTKFKVFYWIDNLDERIDDFGDGNEDFIPCVIVNATGQYRPIPELLISDQSFTLQIYFPQSRQGEILSNIDQFSTKIIGKTITVDGKKLVFNMDVPNVSEVKQEHMGVMNQFDPRLKFKETEFYGVLQLRVYFIESGLMYGNDVKYYLKVRGASSDFSQLFKYDSSTVNSKIVATDQMLSTSTAESVVQMNAFYNTITFYFDSSNSLHLDIIKNAELGLNQSLVYTLKIQYGNLSYLTFEKDVIIENVNISQSLGDVMPISLTFKKASVIL